MTGSSSKEVSQDTEAMADMAGELIAAKMDMARRDTQMTHVLRIGSFHMEIIPSDKINIRETFNEILDKLMEKYGDKLLETTLSNTSTPDGRHYG
jgi:hypothetical protein